MKLLTVIVISIMLTGCGTQVQKVSLMAGNTVLYLSAGEVNEKADESDFYDWIPATKELHGLVNSMPQEAWIQ